MDPLGVLQAVIAVSIYPGGAYLVLAALGLGWAGGLPRGAQFTFTEAAGVIAATVAAALAPLPGSVLSTLPPPPAFGPAPNLAAAVVLEAAAITLVAGERWSGRWVLASAAPLVPLFLLAAAAATLSLPLLATLPGGLIVAARVLIAGALLTVGPVLVRVGPNPSPARVVVLASITILAMVMALEPVLAGLPAPAAAAAVVAAGSVYGGFLRGLRRVHATPVPLTIIAAAMGAAAVAAILAARI